MMWPEIKLALDENRYELTLTGPENSELCEKNDGQLDLHLYQLTQLNLLRVNKLPLNGISDEIVKLENLTNLILQNNHLKELPIEVGHLPRLKLFDVSFNQLTSLPQSIGSLTSLTTLNASSNKLSNLPTITNCTALALVDVRHNLLTEFPDICNEQLTFLADVLLADNKIQNIPSEITELACLKLLDLCNNEIKIVPGEILDCAKLKDLHLKGNPLTDRRFRKLVEADRCLSRQVLDYVKTHCPRLQATNGKKGAKDKAGKDELEGMCNQLRVLTVTEVCPVVRVTASAREVRPYLVCCTLHGLDLNGDNFKKFLVLQTKLHDTVCEKRLAATIATHDLTKVKSPLLFTAMSPDTIRIQPLSRGKVVSAKRLLQGLKQEAEAQRKQQKRNNSSGIHKYLHLVEGWSEWPCLLDSEQVVISLPPITNAENTKISTETTAIFCEVSSGNSLGKAKEVMDTLVLACLKGGFHAATDPNGKAIIEVQQVRVEEEDGSSLRVLYPSRTDLVFEDERVNVVRVEK